MYNTNAPHEEVYGDVTHDDWCPMEDPNECDGQCNQTPNHH